METLDHARAIYEDTIEGQSTTTAELARQLHARADEVRQDALDALEGSTPDVAEEVAQHLEQAGSDIRKTLSQGAPTLKSLPDGVAGQAQLASSMVEIDPNSIQGDGESIIDTQIAENVRDHELEHTKQSAMADADGIEVRGKQFNAREIREAAAMSVQSRTDFLSAAYKQIMSALPMDTEDRTLVRQGRFKDLERKKNSFSLVQAP